MNSNIIFFMTLVSALVAPGFSHAQSEQGQPPDDSFFKAFKLNDLSLLTRYVYKTERNGDVSRNRLQAKLNIDASIKFYREYVQIDFQGGTGANFAGSWANTGVGDGAENLDDINLRRLSLTFRPIKDLEFSAGSMAPEYGVGSQSTTFDKDGYLAVYRARLNIDDTKIALSAGYAGDYKQPDYFERAGRLLNEDFNYCQALVEQKFTEALAGSLDYSFIDNDHVARAAVRVNVNKLTELIDTVTVENSCGWKSDGENYDLFAARFGKKFADVNLLGQRGILCELGYHYRTDEVLTYPVWDDLPQGSSLNLRAGFANSLFFIEITQSLEDINAIRCEVGGGLRF